MTQQRMQQQNDWQVWEQILELIRSKVTKTSFRAWLQPVSECRVDPDTKIIYLSSPEDMANSILRSRYKELIEQQAEQVLAGRYTVIVETADEEATTIDGEPPSEERASTLLTNYRFENFIVGSGNKLAYGVSKAVAEHPSLAFNPLFLYSASGLGKTHLLHAIGNYIEECFPDKKVMYVSSEEFMRELIDAIGHSDKSRKMVEFKRKYRRVDVLLIDDIQFLEGKEATQEEFFHTFNDLYNGGRQIVISSDRAPGKLERLQERLTTRFSWSMVSDIQPPDFETRVAILNSKAQQMNIEIDDQLMEAFDLIAENIKGNVRELEGALTRLNGFSAVLEKKITPQFVRETLTDILEPVEKLRCAADIKEAVCRKFNVKTKDLESSKRYKEIVIPRHIAMYLCRDLIDLSFQRIGQEFGNRNHATVMSAYEKISQELQHNKELEALVNEMINAL